MPKTPGGHEPHATVVDLNRLIPRRFGGGPFDRERGEPSRRLQLAIAKGGIAANEIFPIKVDESTEARHVRGVITGKLARPYAEALLQPQRVECIKADHPRAR